jgi:6-phosphogluconolactonase/glucosamine-6-phosphate isomerase/deaminase
MQPEDVQSYVRFMREHLFNHIDIKPENANVPDGTFPAEKVADYCRDYEARITAAGGIDIQILGIGRTGHNSIGGEVRRRMERFWSANFLRSESRSFDST